MSQQLCEPDVLKAVVDAVRQETRGKICSAALTDSFADDLDLDSLSVMAVVVHVEDALGIKISDSDTGGIRTVADVVRLALG